MKKRILILVVVLAGLLYSCDFATENTSKTAVIDYARVDEVPLFLACKDLKDEFAKKNCFYEAVHDHLKNTLKTYNFISKKPIARAKLMLYIEIGLDGKVSLYKIEMSEDLKAILPKLTEVIGQSIVTFPVLKPAKKKGMSVVSRYKIPIVLDS